MTKFLTPSLIALALAGCSSKPSSERTLRGAGEAQTVFAEIVREIGANFDACFSGAPAMIAPGAPQNASGMAASAVSVNKLVIAIDSSGSMARAIGGLSKLDAAKRAATAFLSKVPAGTQIGLVAFGHKGSNAVAGKGASCAGVETIYPLGSANATQIGIAMAHFRPVGWTPLASAIRAAGGEFGPDQAGRQVVYVVSDGVETCGGDPVAAARALHTGPVKAIINIIGFDLGAADRAQLRAVADAGGGTFVETEPSGIGKMLDDLQRKAGAVSAITRERFDAGRRTTDNNLAAGRYVTKVNMCLYHGADDENRRLRLALEKRDLTPEVRDAVLTMLNARQKAYLDRSEAIAADIDARRKGANGAIGRQSDASEARLQAP